MVVAQLVERSPEVRGLDPVIGKLSYTTFVYCQLNCKDENKDKEARNGPFKNKMFSRNVTAAGSAWWFVDRWNDTDDSQTIWITLLHHDSAFVGRSNDTDISFSIFAYKPTSQNMSFSQATIYLKSRPHKLHIKGNSLRAAPNNKTYLTSQMLHNSL